ERQLRERLARLINAPSGMDIALLKNTSEALSFVALGLSWEAGDEVVITSDEFPSNRIVWESLHERGVKVVEADLHSGRTPEDAILAALTEATRLVSISSVQYASGIRLNLEQIGAVLKERDILFCVDAIQSIGALQFDVQAIQADFVMADGHKWMLGPEGLALFYVHPNVRNDLKLLEYGWHMVQNRGNYDEKTWQPAEDATRFECGSPNMLGAHALNASISLLLEVGMEKVEASLLAKIAWLARELGKIEGLQFISPITPGRHAGILTFQVDQVSGVALQHALMGRGVICAYRGGGVRFSPHFYTPQSVLENAVKIVEEEVRRLR